MLSTTEHTKIILLPSFLFGGCQFPIVAEVPRVWFRLGSRSIRRLVTGTIIEVPIVQEISSVVVILIILEIPVAKLLRIVGVVAGIIRRL